MLFMTPYAVLIISVHKILYFMCFSQKRDQKHHGLTNGRTHSYPREDASKKQKCACIVIKIIVNDKKMKVMNTEGMLSLEKAANGCPLSSNVFIQ